MSVGIRLRHASDDLVARYTDGSLRGPGAWSLERHLERCGSCAARVSAAVRATSAAEVLADVRTAVLASSPAPAPALPTPASRPQAPAVTVAREPGAGHARARPSTIPARRGTTGRRGTPRQESTGRPVSRLVRVLWAAGPAVRGAWVAAVGLVAAAAPLLAHAGGVPGTRALLLAVAPALPVAGVALSYGPHADPLHEITAATPSGGLRLLLTRTAAVLAVCLPLLTLAGLLLPASGAPAAVAWLLPGLALTLATLALTPRLGCRAAATLTGIGWLATVLAPAAAATGDGGFAARLAERLSRCLDGATAQGGWAAAGVLCALLLTARRTAYDHLDRR